jgi:hypothetical protein
MKQITVPANVQVEVTPGAPKQEASFAYFLIQNSLADDQFGVSLDALQASNRMVNALAGKQPGDKVSLSDEDWKILCTVMHKPTKPYPVLVARQIWSFIHAVFSAVNVSDPEPDLEPSQVPDNG